MCKKKHDENIINIESKILSIIALTPAVFNLKIHLVKIPEAGEAAAPLMYTAPAFCV
jgi:hypothetical protein